MGNQVQRVDLIGKERCPCCGNLFTCSTSNKCWCYEVSVPLSVLESIEELYDSCLCPSCLNEMIKKERNLKSTFTRKDFIHVKKRKPGNL